jgi:hypothetical protein
MISKLPDHENQHFTRRGGGFGKPLQRGRRQLHRSFKFEIRNTELETNSNDKNLKQLHHSAQQCGLMRYYYQTLYFCFPRFEHLNIRISDLIIYSENSSFFWTLSGVLKPFRRIGFRCRVSGFRPAPTFLLLTPETRHLKPECQCPIVLQIWDKSIFTTT